MKVLAVGDIHTKLWIIEEVEKLVEEYDRVVFVGDYADDWGVSPQCSIATWSWLMKLEDKFPDKVSVVMGNHDYIYVNYTKTTQSGYDRFTQTLIDVPENRELWRWLKGLPVTLTVDGVTYSHAGFTGEWFKQHGLDKNYSSAGNDLWTDDSPLWARPPEANYMDIPQVFGHTPSETCWEVQPNVWCIDTFSTYPNGDPIGDQTVLEILDGKKFTKRKIKNDDNNTDGVTEGLPREGNHSD